MDPSAFFGSEQYVDRYCRELDLSEQARRRARDIVETTAEVGADSGCSPTGWAGAAVYNAAIEYDTGHGQSDIADVANCTEVTIRNRYQEQQEVLRRVESIPTEPHAAVRYLVERTGAGLDVSTVAHELIDRSNSTEADFSAEPLLWTLAALRRAGQLVDETVSMKMLSRFTEESSDEIARRTNELRSVLSPREARGLIE
jgi:transcription initiation factor TFIIB